MDESSSLHYINSPHIKSISNLKLILDCRNKKPRAINTAKLTKKVNNINSFFSEKSKKIPMKDLFSQRINSTRNKIKIHVRVNKKIQSALFKNPKFSQLNISSFNIKNKTPSSLINHRNYSAYYINFNSYNKNNYISDLLISNDDNNKDKSQKLSDIEKKLSKIESELNLEKIKKCNSLKNNGFLTPRLRTKKIKKENEKNMLELLKEKFYIKGTNVLSPLCLKAKSGFIMKIFENFLDQSKTLKTDKTHLIDNKLNIIYAENENIYKDKIKKINLSFLMKGKKEKHKFYSPPSDRQLRDISKEVTLMKNIFDFAYPNTIMDSLRDNKKYLKKNKTYYKKFESMYNKSNFDICKNNFYELKFK